MDSRRAEAFSDGVFAVAITVLVFNLLGIGTHGLTARPYHLLLSAWPNYFAYVVSFLTIGIMWVNHHTVFGHFARLDRNVVYLNLALLATVVFVPYPTGIFGEALQRGEGERVAAVFYSVVMTVNAVAWAAVWLYGSSHRRLLDPGFPEEQRHTATILFTIGTAMYLGTIVVALVNAYACLAVHGALAVYYALDPLQRWVSRLTE